MTDSRIFKVEKRTGRERTIKSYVLRNNVLDEKGEKTIEESKEYIEYYDGEKKLSSVTLFNNSRPLIVEIGFGMGDATVEIAENRKDFNYLGLEVYLDGVVKILKKIREKDLKNLKIMRFNAVDVITDMIEDGSIDGFHIFFPDPWMKKKPSTTQKCSRSNSPISPGAAGIISPCLTLHCWNLACRTIAR